MRLALIAPLLLAACAVPQAGTPDHYRARNGLTVTPTGAETFHVAYGGLIGTTDFWCSAGDYVMHGLGKPMGTMIYRASPPPRHAGQGIDFSLDAAAAQPTGIIFVKGNPVGLTAGAAESYCEVEIRLPGLLTP